MAVWIVLLLRFGGPDTYLHLSVASMHATLSYDLSKHSPTTPRGPVCGSRPAAPPASPQLPKRSFSRPAHSAMKAVDLFHNSLGTFG